MNNSIQLKVPLRIRLASIIFTVSGYWLTANYFPQSMLPLGYILWTWFILRGLFYSPEMTIHPHGIETQRLWWRHFLSWDDIAFVRFGELHSQIYPKNIHPLVQRLIYNNLMIMKWRENYPTAIALIKSQIEERDNRPQRAYE